VLSSVALKHATDDRHRTFESHIRHFFLGLYPSIIARKAYKARARAHCALQKWYEAGHDQETGASDVIRTRAALLRNHGLSAAEFSKLELSVMHGATSNTIPTQFWLTTFIWLRPQLVEELRAEALAMQENRNDSRKGIINIQIGRLEEACPLLVSCYREAIRLTSQPITSRRVARDFTLSDPVTGKSYLLRKGADVMLPATVLHRLPSVWGADADGFNPRRFLASSKNDEDEKKQRGAYMPFGGGKRMCPGRHFAFAENLGFITALVLGFEVIGLKEENVRMANAKLGEAIAKPEAYGEGGTVIIRRRRGWEEVEWSYTV
jgi:cytochrome P450